MALKSIFDEGSTEEIRILEGKIKISRRSKLLNSRLMLTGILLALMASIGSIMGTPQANKKLEIVEETIKKKDLQKEPVKRKPSKIKKIPAKVLITSKMLKTNKICSNSLRKKFRNLQWQQLIRCYLLVKEEGFKYHLNYEEGFKKKRNWIIFSLAEQFYLRAYATRSMDIETSNKWHQFSKNLILGLNQKNEEQRSLKEGIARWPL